MELTNLQIIREIAAYLRSRSAVFTMQNGVIYYEGANISVKDGYVIARMRIGSPVPISYQIEYVNAARWFKKFADKKEALDYQSRYQIPLIKCRHQQNLFIVQVRNVGGKSSTVQKKLRTG